VSDDSDRVELALKQFGSLSLNPPASKEDVDRADSELGKRIPLQYRRFLELHANGGVLDSLELFPVRSNDPRLLKRTWNSIQRNNRPGVTAYIAGDELSLSKFMVFGAIGATCFSLEYEGGSCVWLWQPSMEEMVELDYDFASWLYETGRMSLR
jgi:hypothetical protein